MEKLRSQQWFGSLDKNGFIHRSWMKNQGLPARSVRWPAGHRHLQYLVRADALQRPLPRARRAREARRLGGWRLPAGISGDVARRNAAAPDRHAVPQPGQHGRRRIDPRQSDRWRRAADGLRQDHAGAADGRGVRAICPTIGLSGGPMLNGKFRGKDIGSGTDVWQMSEKWCAPAR